MSDNLRVIVAVSSVLMTLFGYSFYIRDTFAGKTKPHAYSWLVWASLTTIAFFGQISDGAGAGAWVTATTAFISFFVFVLALKKGEKDVTNSDRVNLASAFFALFLWAITSNALTAILLITFVDFLEFLPTIRKSYMKPHQETLIHYVFAGLKFVLGIIALDNYSLTTWLYPASLVLANWLFIVMLIVRRKKLNLYPKKRLDYGN